MQEDLFSQDFSKPDLNISMQQRVFDSGFEEGLKQANTSNNLSAKQICLDIKEKLVNLEKEKIIARSEIESNIISTSKLIAESLSSRGFLSFPECDIKLMAQKASEHITKDMKVIIKVHPDIYSKLSSTSKSQICISNSDSNNIDFFNSIREVIGKNNLINLEAVNELDLYDIEITWNNGGMVRSKSKVVKIINDYLENLNAEGGGQDGI